MMSDPGVRAFWLKHLHRWHWISAGLCLVGMLLFAVTGITLNHAGSIEAKPQVTSREAQLPEALLKSLPAGEQSGALAGRCAPLDRRQRFRADRRAQGRMAEARDLRLAAAPGRRRVADHRSRRAATSSTSSPTAAGSPTSTTCTRAATPALMWSLFIDVFAVACLVFCITGLCLLQFHSARRPATWPVVGLGIVIPSCCSCCSCINRGQLMRRLVTLGISGVLAGPLLSGQSLAAEHDGHHRGAQARRRRVSPPYVAAWIEGADGTVAANLNVWYDLKQEDKKGNKWLKDMRQWWRRAGRDLDMPVDGLSSATRPAGKHALDFDAATAPLATLQAGRIRARRRSRARGRRPRDPAHSVQVAGRRRRLGLCQRQGRARRSRTADQALSWNRIAP